MGGVILQQAQVCLPADLHSPMQLDVLPTKAPAALFLNFYCFEVIVILWSQLCHSHITKLKVCRLGAYQSKSSPLNAI